MRVNETVSSNLPLLGASRCWHYGEYQAALYQSREDLYANSRTTCMIEYEQVLLPTDGSDASQSAIEYAVSTAARHSATLHTLHVIDAGPDSTEDTTGGLSADELNQEAKSYVESVTEQADDAGVAVEASIESGVAHRSIIEYVDANDIDLVVMGTRGRSGIHRFLLGSVAEKVIRTVDAPVMTIRPNLNAET